MADTPFDVDDLREHVTQAPETFFTKLLIYVQEPMYLSTLGIALPVAYHVLVYFFPTMWSTLIWLLVTLLVIFLLGYALFRWLLKETLASKQEARKAALEEARREGEARGVQIRRSLALGRERSPYFDIDKVFRAPRGTFHECPSDLDWNASDKWVSFFGFGPTHFPLMYKILNVSGVYYHVCGSGETNWIHLQCNDPFGFIGKNNAEIAPGVHITVRRTNMDHLAAVRELVPQEPEPEPILSDAMMNYIESVVKEYEDSHPNPTTEYVPRGLRNPYQDQFQMHNLPASRPVEDYVFPSDPPSPFDYGRMSPSTDLD